MKNKIKKLREIKGLISISILVALITTLASVYFFSERRDDVSNQCAFDNLSEKEECWWDTVEKTIDNKGISAAFELIAYLHSLDPQFAPVCHGLVHRIGYKSYDLFEKNKDIDLSDKAAICNFGFYHGFMEQLVVKSNDISKAREFCEYIENKFSTTSTGAGLQCFHGLGHGTANADSRPSDWGDEEKITKPALEICEKVVDSEDRLYRCVSGVFNGLANFTIQGEYGLVINKSNPSRICNNQPDKYKEACYGNMNSTILTAFDGDLSRSLDFAINIEDEYIPKTVEYVAAEWGMRNINTTDFGSFISSCRKLNSELSPLCIMGVARGFYEGGSTPEKEHVKSLILCDSSLLHPDDKKPCYSFVVESIIHHYSELKAAGVCREGSDALKEICTEKGI